MLCCETRSCYARHHNDLKGHSNFSSTIYSYSILCLEHHYCGDQQWRLLTQRVKSAKCLCLLPAVLVLVLRIWSCLHHRGVMFLMRQACVSIATARNVTYRSRLGHWRSRDDIDTIQPDTGRYQLDTTLRPSMRRAALYDQLSTTSSFTSGLHNYAAAAAASRHGGIHTVAYNRRKNMGSGSVRSSHQTGSDYTLRQWFPNTQQSRFLIFIIVEDERLLSKKWKVKLSFRGASKA